MIRPAIQAWRTHQEIESSLSNNLPDAVAIANDRGFDTIQVLTSMTLDSGTDFRGFKIIGKSHVNTLITIASDALCENAIIQQCQITGVLDGRY